MLTCGCWKSYLRNYHPTTFPGSKGIILIELLIDLYKSQWALNFRFTGVEFIYGKSEVVRRANPLLVSETTTDKLHLEQRGIEIFNRHKSHMNAT